MRTQLLRFSMFVVACSLVGQIRAESFSQAVQALSPQAYWQFQDASSANGATAASTVNPVTYNGAYQSGNQAGDGVTFGSSAFPALGQAAYFHNNGANTTLASSDAVLAPATSFATGNADRTLIFWEKSNVVAGGQYLGQTEYGTPGTFTSAWGTSIFATFDGNSPQHGQAVSQWGDGTGTTTPADDGNWHFVAVTTSTAGQPSGFALYSIYLDGVLANVPKSMNTNTVATQMQIGSSTALDVASPGIVGWNGGLDEVAMFNRTLSAIDVAHLYAVAANPVPEPSTLLLALVAAAGVITVGVRRRSSI